jgi:hypothetical protein
MKKINQVHISQSVLFFSEDFKKKYSLVDYYQDFEPSIFFGMYRNEDVDKLVNHKSISIVIWCGSDALKSEKYIKYLLPLKNVIHISISSFVKNSLEKNGIKSKLIPIRPKSSEKNLKPRGNKIYFYYGKESSWDFYGGDIVDKLKGVLPYEIICTNKNSYNSQQLEKIYEDCFIGLRLTKHDGCSNTVCELGLMGRKCIHNGDVPNSINYQSFDDIVNSIHTEYHTRNEDNSKICDEVFNYLNISDDWLYVS